MNNMGVFKTSFSKKCFCEISSNMELSEKTLFEKCFYLVQGLESDNKKESMVEKWHNLDCSKKINEFLKNFNFKNEKFKVFFSKENDANKKIKQENLVIYIEPLENNYALTYLFNPKIYLKEEITILDGHFNQLIKQISQRKDISLDDIDIVSEFEKEMINLSNDTEKKFSENLCIHERISQTAKMYPNEIALEYNGQLMTYDELEKASNRLARYLMSKGIKRESLVGIMVPRGINLIVAMIGVMKSGASYIPLSKKIPLSRLDYMLEHSKAVAIISDEDITLNSNIKKININTIDLNNVSSEDIESQTTPTSTAAVIFTSGTTGNPKGVLVRHNTVVNYCEFNLDEIVLPVGSHVVQFAPFVFSTMIYEVITTLFSGARLHLVDDEVVTDIRQFQKYILSHPINFLLLPSQYVNYIQIPDTIITIETGASDCQLATSNKIDQCANHLHAYGLTEGSIVAVWKRRKEQDYSDLKKIPMGKPVYNTQAYVLNKEGHQQGMYMQGELCVTGLAISNGYLNLPELTKQRFVENPFGEGLMLKTGDIVQWNYQGELEYIGRVDNQVKIRGMRVEVEEIEYQLAKNQEILAAAVIDKVDEIGEHYLVAFVMSSIKLDIKMLQEKLANQLLDYMIPSFIQQVPQMPMTVNGKIDKKELANIKIVREKQVVKPNTKTEKKLVTFFEETLNLTNISIKDDFFELGGHSLRASKLLNLIEENFSVHLNFSDIFTLLTPEKIGKEIDSRQKVNFQSIEKVPKAAYYPLSPAQKRMFFVNQLEENRCTYNLPYLIAIKGRVEVERLTKVMQDLVNRHEMLRTRFKLVDGLPVQVIEEHVEANVTFQDRPDVSIDSDFDLFSDFIRPFNLEKAPLIRFELIHVAEGNSLLLVDMHHIISDGMSLNILVSDLSDLFNGRILPSVQIDYKDYVAWINHYDYSREEAYWKQEFASIPETLNLPLDNPRPSCQSLEAGFLQSKLSPELTKQIKQLAKKQGVTEYMVFLSALMVLLSKYSRQDEVVVGSPISGRVHQDTEKMLGLFINSLAMKGYPLPEKSYLEFLSEIKKTSLKAFENQNYPFDKLVDSLNVSRDLSRHPLFDVMLVVQNNEKQTLNFDGFETEVIIPEEKNAQYDMTFAVAETENLYDLNINFSSAIFNLETIQYLEQHFENILNQITKRPQLLIRDIVTTDKEEEEKIRTIFNDTHVNYNHEKTVIDLFEENVLLNPEKEMLIFEDEKLTYLELNIRANQIAHFLREQGIKPNDFVALVTNRSVEMFVGALGVLKAGAAYVPINTKLPENRLDFMLDNLNPAMILTYKAEVNSRENRRIIDLASFNYEEYSQSNPVHVNSGSDAVYSIYTSGTTGKPKAVVIEHKNMTNYCQTYPTMVEASQLEQASLLSVSEYSFDIFTTDFLFALTNAITVYLANEQQAIDPYQFGKLLEQSNAKIIKITPTKFKLLTSHNKIGERSQGLKLIIVGGEAVSSDFHAYVSKLTQAKVVNAYGPTETSVLITDTELTGDRVTIGKPIANCSVYIEAENKLAGIGVPGELLIAGEGVGRGYLNQEELTKEKFKKNPYGKGTIYSTGDLARWLPNGEIEYLGRIDSQVKIRGFRIELEEIAVVLRKQTEITDAAVITRLDHTGELSIHAYFVSQKTIDIDGLKENLRMELPDYMVPMYLLQIEEIPHNSSGKLNVAKLPEISLEIKAKLEPLKNSQEEKVAKIFSEVLGIDQIGANSHFFELGGHSLRLTSIVNSLEQAFNQRLALQEIYAHPTVEGIANLLSQTKESTDYHIPLANRKEYYPMSPAQQRLYVVSQMEDVGISYNIPTLFKVDGKIDKERIQKVVNVLVDRHEILRTSFKLVNQELVQCIENQVKLIVNELTNEDISEFKDESELLNYLVRPFDLNQAPLMRISVISASDKASYLFIDMHHIISDGTSVNILLKEFYQLYHDELKELPEMSIQYKDYSEWVISKDLSQPLEYWKKELENGLSVLNLPTNYQRTPTQSFKGHTLKTTINATIRKQIETLAVQKETTPFTVLLSLVMILLSKQSHQEDVVIGSPVSGRTNQQTENLLGMFVNNLVLRGNVSDKKNYLAFLEEIKEMMVNTLENQDLPYEKLIGLIDSSAVNRNPLFDVMFVYQNDEEIDHYLKEMKVTSKTTIESIAKFDLSIMISEKNQGYELSFNYATSLFNESSIQYMMAHFECLMVDVLNEPDKEIGQVQVVSTKEKQLILETFNQPIEQPLLASNVHELFQKNVDNAPNKLAIVFGNKTLTYAELNSQSEKVASYLLEKGLSKGEHVALLFTRSIEMIVAMLGVNKAGGVYIPIEPSTPNYRIATILADSKPKYILSNVANYQNDNYDVLMVQECLSNDYVIRKNIYPILNASDKMYVLFTSGTTGKPKGVVVKQEGIINLQSHFREKFDVTSDDNILQFANYTFDASIWEITMALLNGGTLYLSDEELINNTEKMTSFIKENITVATLPPQYAEQLPLEKLNLRLLVTAGSKAIKDVALRLRGRSRFINAYGPSETTVCATSWEDKGDSDLVEAIPIGQPIINSQSVIMVENKMVGIGMPGELCVFGRNISQGYLNMKEKTAESFVISDLSESVLYKTGDLARFRPDGNIEYLGRIDRQVKLRGFRIELVEIEESLKMIDGVQDAAVILREETSGGQILGYVVMTENQEFNQEQLKKELANKLPNYMVPSYLMELETIPMTLNGKLDENGLPEIKKEHTLEFEAPENEVEAILVTVFEAVLDVSDISVMDSFFDLGGDSIKAIRIVSKLREQGYELEVKEMLQSRTIREIAQNVNRSQNQQTYSQEPVVGEFSLTPIQYYFFDNNMKAPEHFNQSIMLESQKDLRPDIVKETLLSLVEHHDALRSTFINQKQIILDITEENLIYFETVKLNETDSDLIVKEQIEKINNQVQKEMNLLTGPLVRAVLYKTSEMNYLFITIHHLVVDGVSWRILLEDFSNVFNQLLAGKQVVLPKKTASVKEWSEAVIAYGQSEELEKEFNYWNQQVNQIEPIFNKNNSTFTEYAYKTETTKLGLSLTNELVYEANKAFNTEVSDLLLVALGRSIQSQFNVTKYGVQVEGHGREELGNQELHIDRTVGWFTSIYPVMFEVENDIETDIISVKETLRKVPNNGIGFNILKYHSHHNFSENRPEIGFNYLGNMEKRATGDSLFEVSAVSTGQQVAEENDLGVPLLLTTKIEENQLLIDVTYNELQFDANQMVALINDYKKELTKIIEFCASHTENTKTLSDFGVTDLEMDDLEALNDLLGDL